MLDEIYEHDDALTEDEYYDALFYLLGDRYPHLSDEELEDLLADMLDQLPEAQAESVMQAVGGLGKSFGKGALQFAAKNPQIVKGGLTLVGTAFGGPLGAKLGNMAGNAVTQAAQKQAAGQNPMLPATGRALTMMQNPQAQAALAQATLGVGDGTAPFTQNGKYSRVPVSIYLRAVIATAQGALKEMDSMGLIPPASAAESLPFGEDIDQQAEWLADQLAGSLSSASPITLTENTYFMYANGQIERYAVNSNSVLTFIYVDAGGTLHNLGSFATNTARRWVSAGKRSSNPNDLIELVYMRTLQPYAAGVQLGIKTWNSEQYQRYYMQPNCFAALLGAMAENSISDLRFNGASQQDGSPTPSVEHLNGEIFDLGYLRTDQSAAACLLQDAAFDYQRQVDFNNSLYKFGFARTGQMFSEKFGYGGEKDVLLPHTKHLSNPRHNNHLHIKGFDHSLVVEKQYVPPPSPNYFKTPNMTHEPDATRVSIRSPR